MLLISTHVNGPAEGQISDAVKDQVIAAVKFATTLSPAEKEKNDCVQAVEDETGVGEAVRAAYRDLAGADLPAGKWPETLYSMMSRSELIFQLDEALAKPRPLQDLPEEIEEKIGRPVTEAEILSWLTLGAAARYEGRPLLRPVVHGFLRGISGAVVSFPETDPGPRLWLAAEDEIEARDGEARPIVSEAETAWQRVLDWMAAR